MIEDDNRVLNYRGLEHLVEKLKLFFIKRPITGTEGQYLRLTSTGAVEWASFPSIFTYMGSKSTVADVWAIKNAKQGDVWSVGNDEYFCKVATTTSDYGEQHWELIGLIITPYTLPVATSSALGGIQLYTDTKLNQTPQTPSTTTDRTYAVQLNSSNQAVVNVPWSTSAGTVTSVTAGRGLLGGTITSSGTIDIDTEVSTPTISSNAFSISYDSKNFIKKVFNDEATITINVNFQTPKIGTKYAKEVICRIDYAHIAASESGSVVVKVAATGVSGTLANMYDADITDATKGISLSNGESLELVFTFWDKNDVSFNGGISEAIITHTAS